MFSDKPKVNAEKVAAIHSYFDRDGDGYLNHSELRGLQLITSDTNMDQTQYLMVCRSLACDPNNGLSLDALKLVYASEGAELDEDYSKVFTKKETTKDTSKDNNDVLEIGEDGVDISN